MTKPKLLYIVTQGESGGAQRYVYDLATNLADDFCVTIAVGEHSGRRDLQNKIKRSKDQKITIVQLEHLVRKISPIHDILAISEIAKLYKTLKPDIIHLNSSKAGILGSLAKLFAENWKLIYTVHGWVFNEPLGLIKKTLYRWLEKFTTRWKNKIIVLSDSDYQTGQQAGIPTDKLVKIPLGIETPKFLDRDEARQMLSKISNIKYQISNILIVTIANLYPTKGIDVLIDAVGLQLTTYNLQLIVIGEGPERKNLEDLIKKYQLEQIVHLVGAIDNAAQYLRAFDMFVLPSRKEGLPYTLLEAVAAGVPTIATDVGGVKELIADAIVPNDPKILAEKIIKTIKNPIHQQKNTPHLREMLEKTKTIYLSFLLPKS